MADTRPNLGFRQDIFIYDKDRIFNTGIDGQLVVEDEHGVTRTFTHKSTIKMSKSHKAVCFL